MKNQLIKFEFCAPVNLRENEHWRINRIENGRHFGQHSNDKFEEFDECRCFGEIGSTGIYRFLLIKAGYSPRFAHCIIRKTIK